MNRARRIVLSGLFLIVFAAILLMLVVPVIANGSRICFGPGEVRAAVFMLPDGGIEVYTINAQDRGELRFSFTQSFLGEQAGDTSSNLLLGASNRNIHIEFWRLTSGEYRVLAGPDAENKMFECIFGGASTIVRSYLYSGEELASVDEDETDIVAATPTPGANDDPGATDAPDDTIAPTSAGSTAQPTQQQQQPTDPPAQPTQVPPTPVSTREVTFGG